jgi:hypothetical protein
VVDPPRGADYTIWAVAFLFYLFDAARLVSPRAVLLVEAGGGRLAAAFSDNPYTLAGRVLAFGPVLLPYRAVFVAPWGRPWTERAALDAVIDHLAELRRTLLGPRILAAAAFALLFVVGPVLTFALGVNAAVVYTAAALYPAVVAAIVWLWWRRAAFGLTAGKAALISVEVLACPAFLPNLVRKITGPTPVDADATQILFATAAPEVVEEFLARLEIRTETLIGETGADESGEGRLRSYLAAVKGARPATTP